MTRQNPPSTRPPQAWKIIATIHARRWQSQSLYWLRSVGINVKDRDIFSRLYIVYMIAIAILWVGVSFSMVLTMASRAGHPFPVPDIEHMPYLAVIVAIAVITASSLRSPFSLAHGDLEWMAPSPLSSRVLMPFYFIPQQLRAVGITVVVASLAAAFLHLSHIAAFTAAWTLWIALARTWGWVSASLRFSRRLKPYRCFWAGVLTVLLISALVFPLPWIFMAQGVEPGHLALVRLGAGLALSWILAFTLSGFINLLSVQEASLLYADIQGLGTLYWPNRELVRQIEVQRRLAGARVHGRLPLWPEPYLEWARFALTLIRRPRTAFMLLELALLFRSALMLTSPHAGHWAWLFWLFLAYRFRQGNLSAFFIEDVSNPFVSQFLPQSLVTQFVRSSILPVFTVWILTVGLWLLLPLGTPFSFGHLVLTTSLIAAWALGEGTAVITSAITKAAPDNYHLVAVSAAGAVMALAVPLHHMAWTPLVPLVLIGILTKRAA